MSKFVLVFIFLFLLELCNEVNGGCNVTLKELGDPSPVYIHNGGFLLPDPRTGRILLRRSETLEVACPGVKKFVVLGNNTTGFDVLQVKCVNGTLFRATKTPWVGNLKDVRCNAPPWFTTEETNKSCSGIHSIYRVGYNIGNNFYELYQACFDKSLLRTLYVQELLRPESKFIELGRRPAFIEGDVFGKVKISKAYKTQNQKLVFKQILGSGMEDIYVTNSQHINRGHLAARANFPLRAQQKATFHYINVAPQWMRGNAGDWAALEDALRRRVHALGSAVTVYTGTSGICTLADTAGVFRQLYLTVDQNDNYIVPVPMYFYKVVYDSKKHTAVAFISINSSYYNTTTIEDLSFCSDICDKNPQFSWLKWRPKDGTHSFCCEYDSFIQSIHNLPALDVRGLFY